MYSLLRRLPRSIRVDISKGLSSFRTLESDPFNHDSRTLGKVYEVPQSVSESINPPSELRDYADTFGEMTLLIRRPALEVFHYLNQRKEMKTHIMLFGPKGSGKSAILSHVSHFVLNDPSSVLLNFGRFKSWLTNFSVEVAHSNWKTGRIDHIKMSLDLLKEFRSRNSSVIADLLTHKEYVWTAREKTPENSPLSQILEQGIERPKFANDVLNALLLELRWSANEGKIRFVILGDGLNCLFGSLTSCHREKLTEERIHRNLNRDFLCVPDELSIVYNLKKALKCMEKNVVFITSVDAHEILRTRPEERHKPTRKRPFTGSDLPFALLGEEGWKVVGPFLPVEVEFYSKEELETMTDLHLEKNYIDPVAKTEAGRAEIAFLTGHSPLDFATYSHYW